nr:uncharacterized protein C7orf50 homolog isoform X5 [Equus caballus]
MEPRLACGGQGHCRGRLGSALLPGSRLPGACLSERAGVLVSQGDERVHGCSSRPAPSPRLDRSSGMQGPAGDRPRAVPRGEEGAREEAEEGAEERGEEAAAGGRHCCGPEAAGQALGRRASPGLPLQVARDPPWWSFHHRHRERCRWGLRTLTSTAVSREGGEGWRELPGGSSESAVKGRGTRLSWSRHRRWHAGPGSAWASSGRDSTAATLGVGG